MTQTIPEVILVIGGSRGAGKAIAMAAGARGAAVVVLARGSDETRQTALELLAQGGVGVPILADIADLADRAASERVLTGCRLMAGGAPTAILLATPGVRAGSLGPLATLVRLGVRAGATRIAAISQAADIAEEIREAAAGVPFAYGVSVLPWGAPPDELVAAGLKALLPEKS